MGDPFRVDVPLLVPIRGYCAPPVIERRRFQRLGGTIADNHLRDDDVTGLRDDGATSREGGESP